jgi:hypothetical protein
MAYSKYSLKQNNKKVMTTPWTFKEGVFQTRKGDYIVRIKKGSLFETLSRHEDLNEANEAYKKAKSN